MSHVEVWRTVFFYVNAFCVRMNVLLFSFEYVNML